VQWLKDNKAIKTGDHFVTGSVGRKHYLIINDINPDDVGLYTVAATNSLGTSSSSAAINVLPGITIFCTPNHINIVIHNSYIFLIKKS